MLVVDPTLPENALAFLEFHYIYIAIVSLFALFGFNYYSLTHNASLKSLLLEIKGNLQVSFGKG
jgi:hypothetical protein